MPRAPQHSIRLPKLTRFAGGMLLILFLIPLSVQLTHAHTDSSVSYKKEGRGPVVHQHQVVCRVCDYYLHKQSKDFSWLPPSAMSYFSSGAVIFGFVYQSALFKASLLSWTNKGPPAMV